MSQGDSVHNEVMARIGGIAERYSFNHGEKYKEHQALLAKWEEEDAREAAGNTNSSQESE